VFGASQREKVDDREVCRYVRMGLMIQPRIRWQPSPRRRRRSQACEITSTEILEWLISHDLSVGPILLHEVLWRVGALAGLTSWNGARTRQELVANIDRTQNRDCWVMAMLRHSSVCLRRGYTVAMRGRAAFPSCLGAVHGTN
jgi:hypothetical protein